MRKLLVAVLIVFPLLTCSFYAYNYHYKSKNQVNTINAIMDYKMPQVVARCKKDHDYSDEDMVILEQELKRYLALSVVTTKDDLGTGMYSSDVDNLWHSFILFTPEYADFCHTHMGHFIHHMPETDEIRSPEKQEASRKDFQAFVNNYEKTFNQEIHPIWFLDMC